MAMRFRKSFRVAPGMRINVSSRGVGASVGVKGLHYSVNSRGQRRTTASIPGTGAFPQPDPVQAERIKVPPSKTGKHLLGNRKKLPSRKSWKEPGTKCRFTKIKSN